jgi:hypothetical protein
MADFRNDDLPASRPGRVTLFMGLLLLLAVLAFALRGELGF